MKNIDCVLKLSISYVLKKILEKLVTNVYSWDEIKFNEEIKVFHFLNPDYAIAKQKLKQNYYKI